MEETEDLVIDASGMGSEGAIRSADPRGGDLLVRIQRPATFTVEIGGAPVLKIEGGRGGAVRVELGPDAGERVVLGDSFRSFLNQWLSAHFDAHTHTLPDGRATTPPAPPFTGAQMPEEALSSITVTK